MTWRTALALILVAAGVLGLVYGGFQTTRERHDVKIGPFELAVKSRERFEVPVWLAAGSVGAGTLLLLLERRR